MRFYHKLILAFFILSALTFAVMAENNKAPESKIGTGFDIPIIEDQYFNEAVCNLKEDRMIQIEATDPDSDFWFELSSGPGMIDSVTGMLTYMPDTSGVFLFEVSVHDDEGSASAVITDELHLNSLPQVFCQDSVIYHCAPEEICITTTAFDPDGDVVSIFKLEGIGEFTQIDDSTATTCFMPADLDSADYLFIFRGADECLLNSVNQKSAMFPPCCRDTSLVTVIIQGSSLEISCPEDIIFDDTSSALHCFDYSVNAPDPIVSVISGNATIENGQVCFTPDMPGEYVIMLEALIEGDCPDADTCEFMITVKEPMINEAYFDIKPTSCPNPLDLKANASRGATLPTAILGTEDFDVHDIDPSTVFLNGVAPIKWDYEDVTAPVEKSEDGCECTEDGPDGYMDMTFKFTKTEIIETIGRTFNGQMIKLTITFELYDGTEYSAYNCMIIRSKVSAEEIGPDAIAGDLRLLNNHPNPFNPTTVISFQLPHATEVKLEVVNISGQIIETLVHGNLNAGVHEVVWDAKDNASGVYFYRLSTNDFVETKKMVLLK